MKQSPRETHLVQEECGLTAQGIRYYEKCTISQNTLIRNHNAWSYK